MNKKSDIAKKIEGNRQNAVDLGKQFDKKVDAEYRQYQSMGGIGEYVMSNMVSLLKRIADTVNKNDLAEKIESKRQDAINLGKQFDGKLKEEYQQYQSTGGVGEYITSNTISLLSSAALAIKQNDLAEKIESRRQDAVKLGKKFDKKIDEEYQQYQSMGGIGEYVMSNTVSLLSNAAMAIEQNDLAEKIESRRQDAIDLGKQFDDKLKEEHQQYQSMGGIGEYVTSNTVSLLSWAAKAVGKDDWVQEIEGKRQDAIDLGKQFDDKLKEEYQQYQSMGGIGEYVMSNTVSLAEKIVGGNETADKSPKQIEPPSPVEKGVKQIHKIASPKQIEQLSPITDNTMIYGEKSMSLNIRTYNTVNIYQEVKDNKVSRIYSVVDGKKHGADVIFDKDGKIMTLSLYDRGKALDMNCTKYTYSVTEEPVIDENDVYIGMQKHYYCLLNEKPFGVDIYEFDNNMSVTVYERNGFVMGRNKKSRVNFETTQSYYRNSPSRDGR